MNRQRGSITLEGAISTIVLMAVILTFSSFMKIVHVHGVVQHALIQMASEISQYSYFYSLSGLNGVNDAIATQGTQGSAAVSEGINEVEKFLDNIGNGALVRPDMDKLDPKTMASALAKALAGEVYSAGKTVLINHVVTMPLLESYLPGGKETFFVRNNVVQDGEFAGIDLSKSRYFANTDGNDEIEIVAVYQMEVISPIPIFDEVTIVQSAKSRAFFSAEKYEPAKGETPEIVQSVWELGNGDRAAIIVERENIPDNMPFNFPAVRGFDEQTGTASTYKTLDLNAPSIHGNESVIRSGVQEKLDKLEEFKGKKYDDVSLEVSQIQKVDYYVVIPTKVSQEDWDLFHNEIKKLGNTMKLSDGREVPLNIIIRQVE